MAKKSTLGTALAVMAALLVVGGVGLVWVAWRGVRMLRSEASHAATVATGNAAALAGKSDWIGTWAGGFETLTIEAGGHADFTEQRAGSQTELHGTIAFGKDDVTVDALVTKKTMHIDKPPHLDRGRMVMTLDGVELAKK